MTIYIEREVSVNISFDSILYDFVTVWFGDGSTNIAYQCSTVIFMKIKCVFGMTAARIDFDRIEFERIDFN